MALFDVTHLGWIGVGVREGFGDVGDIESVLFGHLLGVSIRHRNEFVDESDSDSAPPNVGLGVDVGLLAREDPILLGSQYVWIITMASVACIVDQTRERGGLSLRISDVRAQYPNIFAYGYPCIYMSKNIAVSDDVYRLLKREKGDRSFSDVIRERFEESGDLAVVTGAGILDGETYRDVTDDIEQLSQRTVERIDDETP